MCNPLVKPLGIRKRKTIPKTVLLNLQALKILKLHISERLALETVSESLLEMTQTHSFKVVLTKRRISQQP
jgi:hypothetical protein